MSFENKFKSFDFWDGATFGAAVTAIIALGIAWIFAESSTDNYQTLATIVTIPAAVIAASIALYGIRYQIGNVRQQDLASAKAVLPLALTRMIEVSQFGMLLAAGRKNPLSTSQGTQELLKLDDVVLQILRDNIKSADPITREWLVVTIARYQIYFSRAKNWIESSPPSTNAYGDVVLNLERQDAVLDWATFHMLAEQMFEYARGSVAHAPKSFDSQRINSALFLNGIDSIFTQDFEDRKKLRINCYADGNIQHLKF